MNTYTKTVLIILSGFCCSSQATDELSSKHQKVAPTEFQLQRRAFSAGGHTKSKQFTINASIGQAVSHQSTSQSWQLQSGLITQQHGLLSDLIFKNTFEQLSNNFHSGEEHE
ncbi:hypothetical protein [Marinicella rhabdoformis]|uniref:hypothetical protein n=1 Tax=Marinicella rhabdoformis TaxID=2580566 RepID=UPI0012AEC2D9|nr:hypothetical protein [Marinicella rhabdoformis]